MQRTASPAYVNSGIMRSQHLLTIKAKFYTLLQILSLGINVYAIAYDSETLPNRRNSKDHNHYLNGVCDP